MDLFDKFGNFVGTFSSVGSGFGTGLLVVIFIVGVLLAFVVDIVGVALLPFVGIFLIVRGVKLGRSGNWDEAIGNFAVAVVCLVSFWALFKGFLGM